MAREVRGGSPSIKQGDYWWYRVRGELLRTVLAPHVDNADDVLDVGSADGPSVGWLQGRRSHVTLDLDPRGLVPGQGVCGSAMSMPFADASFDLVGAFDVLEHCDPESAMLAELWRVLRPGGRVLLSVPAYQWAWSDFDVHNGHHRRYTRSRAIESVTSAGFEPIRATYAFASTFPFFVAERLARRVRAKWSPREVDTVDVVELPSTPPAVSTFLTWLGRLDDRVLARRNLPFGSSVVIAARKPLA